MNFFNVIKKCSSLTEKDVDKIKRGMEKEAMSILANYIPELEENPSLLSSLKAYEQLYERYKHLMWFPAFKRDFIFRLEMTKIPEGRKRYDKIVENIKTKYPDLLPNRYYQWVRNSCFMDSVIFVIINTIDDFWRRKLLEKPKSKFISDDLLDITEMSFYEFLFEKIEETENTVCLRKAMVKYLRDMNMSSYFEAVTLFSKIAEIYEMEFIVEKTNLTGRKAREKSTLLQGFEKTDKILSDSFVFVPNIVDSKPEKIPDELLKEYEIVGAVENTGGHYVAYAKTPYGYIYYNDLGDELKEIEKIPLRRYELCFLSKKFLH